MSQLHPGIRQTAKPLLLLLFAGVFGGSGILLALPTLASLVVKWETARSYVAVPASVQAVELQVEHGEVDTRRVMASFTYRFKDRDFVGGTVSTSDLFDNFDSYHQRTYDRLLRARSQSGQVQIWVDPQNPVRAVYDRSFRWKNALFMLLFGLVFPVIGAGALWDAIAIRPDKQSHLHPARSGQLHEPVQLPAHTAWAAISLAFYWNLLSWPIGILSTAQAATEGSHWVWLPLLFPAVGLSLLWFARGEWRTYRHIGKPMLELLPTRPHDNAIRGRIHFTPPFAARMEPVHATYPVRISLSMQRIDDEDGHSSKTALWETRALDTNLARGTVLVDFDVALPEESALEFLFLPPEIKWMLELQTLETSLWFDVPAGVSG